MLRVVAGLSGVFEDVQVGGSLAVRLEVGRPYKRSNHSRVAEDLQEEAQVDLGRKLVFNFFVQAHHLVLPGLVEVAVLVEDGLQDLVELLPLGRDCCCLTRLDNKQPVQRTRCV